MIPSTFTTPTILIREAKERERHTPRTDAVQCVTREWAWKLEKETQSLHEALRALVSRLHPGVIGLIYQYHGKEAGERAELAIYQAKAQLQGHTQND